MRYCWRMLHIVTPLDPARQEYFWRTAISVTELQHVVDCKWYIGVDISDADETAVTDIQTLVQRAGAQQTTVVGVQGGSAGRARAATLQLVKGWPEEWVVLLDGDDELLPDGLQRLLRQRRLSKAMWVGSDRSYTSSKRKIYHHVGRRQRFRAPNGLRWTDRLWFHSNNIMVRVECLAKVPYPTDADHYEDTEWLWRLAAMYDGAIFPIKTIRYRTWPGQLTQQQLPQPRETYFQQIQQRVQQFRQQHHLPPLSE